MARPQVYQNRITTSVSLERNLKEVADALGIKISSATTHGLTFLIDHHIKSGKPVDSRILKKWSSVKEQALDDLKEYLSIEQDKQTILSTALEARLESESKLDEKIEVFNDLTDRYETITRRQYDPAIHFIRVKS
jgi:hypothetical protein